MKGFFNEYLLDKINAAISYEDIPYHYGGAKLGIFIMGVTPPFLAIILVCSIMSIAHLLG
jgi:hypothetical protein